MKKNLIARNIYTFIQILLMGIFLSGISCSDCSQNSNHENHHGKEALLKLINKRLLVAPLVAKSKWNTKAPIDDPAREKIILDNVDIQSEKVGVDQAFARNFFQAQFEAGKIVQRRLHHQWQVQNLGPFDPVPELATEVRPVLDSLTPLLLVELKKITPCSCSNRSLKRFKNDAREIISSAFDDQVVKTAIEPIADYCKIK